LTLFYIIIEYKLKTSFNYITSREGNITGHIACMEVELLLAMHGITLNCSLWLQLHPLRDNYHLEIAGSFNWSISGNSFIHFLTLFLFHTFCLNYWFYEKWMKRQKSAFNIISKRAREEIRTSNLYISTVNYIHTKFHILICL